MKVLQQILLATGLTTSAFACGDPILSLQEVEDFGRDGYLVVENFISDQDCDVLLQRIDQIVDGFDFAAHTTVFSTEDEGHIADKHFMESANEITYFFEPGAFGSDGKLQRAPELSINKIGHALHELDPLFKAFTQQPKIWQLATELGIRTPCVTQSMVIFKQPQIGGAVLPHQDASFLHTDPDTFIGFWIALEDATLENGCLWALPGHLDDPLTCFMELEADGTLSFETFDVPEWDQSEMRPLEVKRGSLIAIHSRVPHMSLPNSSDKSRIAYTLHLFDASRSEYLPSNWLQRDASLPLHALVPDALDWETMF